MTRKKQLLIIDLEINICQVNFYFINLVKFLQLCY
jgi:hypothetical protein